MRKYSLSTVILSTFTAFYAHAELKFGVIGGGNYSTFTSGADVSVTFSGNPNTFTGSLGPSGMFGYQFGGILRYEKENWGVETNLLYTTRTAKWHGNVTDGTDNVRLANIATLKQLELPILGTYISEISEKSDFRFNLGMFFSYGMGKVKLDSKASNVPGIVSSTSGDYTWSEFGLRRFNFGGIAGAGVDYALEGNSKLGVELRAQTTFSDMADKLSPAFGLAGNKIGLGSVDILLSYIF